MALLCARGSYMIEEQIKSARPICGGADVAQGQADDRAAWPPPLMKRDWDVVRAVLLAVEARTADSREVTSDDIAGVEPDVAAYHMWLLINAGFAEGGGRDLDAMGPPYAFVLRLTWPGHELLDEMRADTTWNKIKDTAREKGIELTFESIKALARFLIEQILR